MDWLRSGRLITGELLLFSGHEQENAPHTQRVALILSTATFRTKERRINIDMIQCYAPANDNDDQDKEDRSFTTDC